jgi:hypothetical protein
MEEAEGNETVTSIDKCVNRVTPKYVQTLEDMHKTLPE